jgi:hypothetical protein
MAKILFLLLGLIVGSVAASGAFFVYAQQQRRAFEEERQVLEAKLAAAQARPGINLPVDPGKLLEGVLNQVGNNLPGAPGIFELPGKADWIAKVVTAPDEEAKILDLGKGFVADLENNRLASAYRTTSAAYQQKVERKMFDEEVNKFRELRNLVSISTYREQKARRSADAKFWEYYFTGQISGAVAGKNVVNIALTFAKDGAEWRVQDVEIASEAK